MKDPTYKGSSDNRQKVLRGTVKYTVEDRRTVI